MSLDRLLTELLLERYGPVVHDAERVPHLPLWLYEEGWREAEQGGDDSEAIAAFERRQEQKAEYDARYRAERRGRQLRVLTDEEAEGAA